jgi:hypothetical protein
MGGSEESAGAATFRRLHESRGFQGAGCQPPYSLACPVAWNRAKFERKSGEIPADGEGSKHVRCLPDSRWPQPHRYTLRVSLVIGGER